MKKSTVNFSLFDRLNAALPQTQCTRCGYPDCATYAHAIASGDAAINQCPPGGNEGVQRLATITGLTATPLNPVHGSESPRSVAVIDEAWCIGCTLCIEACPTDAIFGSNKVMHTVIEPYCTGCELCIPVCPVDCISLENVTGEQTGWNAWSLKEAQTSQLRYEIHRARFSKTSTKEVKNAEAQLPDQLFARLPDQLPELQNGITEANRKRAVIEAALARSRAQRQVKK